MSKYRDPRATQKSPQELQLGDRILMDEGANLTATGPAYKLGAKRWAVDTESRMLQFDEDVVIWVIPPAPKF